MSIMTLPNEQIFNLNKQSRLTRYAFSEVCVAWGECSAAALELEDTVKLAWGLFQPWDAQMADPGFWFYGEEVLPANLVKLYNVLTLDNFPHTPGPQGGSSRGNELYPVVKWLGEAKRYRTFVKKIKALAF